MSFSDKTFEVLDTLAREPIRNQRQLARQSGVSLGQVNYILNSLIEKGFVKVRNLKNNPHKKAYAYLLTPKGIRRKSALAVKFVLSRLEEYERVQEQVSGRLEELARNGHKAILFVGPRAVKELMEEIIEKKGLGVSIKGCFGEMDGIRKETLTPGDVVVVFHDHGGAASLSRDTGIPKDQILSLW